MLESSVDALAKHAANTSMHAAAEYLRSNNVTVTDYEAAAQVIRDEVKAVLSQALDDAQAAINAGMTMIASATFTASMRLAGINAAKKIQELQPTCVRGPRK